MWFLETCLMMHSVKVGDTWSAFEHLVHLKRKRFLLVSIYIFFFHRFSLSFHQQFLQSFIKELSWNPAGIPQEFCGGLFKRLLMYFFRKSTIKPSRDFLCKSSNDCSRSYTWDLFGNCSRNFSKNPCRDFFLDSSKHSLK